MAIRDIAYLKAKFETGDVPTQEDFHDWLDTMFSFFGGSDFDPENILTNLVFNNALGDRVIYKTKTDSGITKIQQLVLSESYTQLFNIIVTSGVVRQAVLDLSAAGYVALNYSSPEGNNQLAVNPNWVELAKVGRYSSYLALSYDLDLVYKYWIESRWSGAWQTIAPSAFLVLDCVARKFPRFNCSLGSTGVGLFVDNPTYLIEGAVNVLTTAATSGLITLDASYMWVLNGEFISTYQLPDGIGKYHVLYFKYNNGIMLLNVGGGATDTDYLLLSAVSNLLTVTAAGSVLDARQGKVLNDLITALTTVVSGKADSTSLANYVLTSAISNLLTVTTAGSVLDARQGKVLNDLISALTTVVSGKASTTYVDTQDKKFNFKLSFNGVRVIEDYWIDAGTVSSPTISSGLTILEYALVTEASYSSTYPVSIPANTRVFWRCTYATNSFTGSANLKGSFTNTI